MTIKSSLSRLKGVGPVLEKALADAGIFTIGDLLDYYPRKWDTYLAIKRIQGIQPGLVSFEAKIERVSMRISHRNRRLTITEAILSDSTGTIKAIWFNQPYLAQTLIANNSYRFRGNYEYKNGYVSLQAPTFEKLSTAPVAQEIIPIYPETKHLSSSIIRKLISQCIDVSDQLEDILPSAIIKVHKLLPKSTAICLLHTAKTQDQLISAKRSIAFEEIFELVLTGLVIKKNIKTSKAVLIRYQAEVAKRFVALLGFGLTNSQKKAAHTILQDISKDVPMNRLLEGDVGSGKTLVALLACVMTEQASYQSAIMVPTEILARQHFMSSQKLLQAMGVKTVLLIANMKKAEKETALKLISSGEVDCIIGTHALIGSNVHYHNLGLVVVDEQHRFGVNQRSSLKGKAKTMPHVLTMTATPIPRSLALVVYGDLDVSIINELPPGRKPIITKLVKDMDRIHVYKHIDTLIDQGQQAYVVCPLISDSDKLGAKSVEGEFRILQKTVFKHRRIGLIHGKLKPDEKSEIMENFKNGKIDMLVATSIVEVGVDVPNATIILIEGADRFGLAALHQLRGRVGRGSQQSHCYLFTASDNFDSLTRLEALEKTNDGFKLAQIDLETRGPGEIYGTTQHGLLNLRLANIFDHELVSEVKQAAEAFINKHNLLEYSQLAEKVDGLRNITSLD